MLRRSKTGTKWTLLRLQAGKNHLLSLHVFTFTSCKWYRANAVLSLQSLYPGNPAVIPLWVTLKIAHFQFPCSLFKKSFFQIWKNEYFFSNYLAIFTNVWRHVVVSADFYGGYTLKSMPDNDRVIKNLLRCGSYVTVGHTLHAFARDILRVHILWNFI